MSNWLEQQLEGIHHVLKLLENATTEHDGKWTVSFLENTSITNACFRFHPKCEETTKYIKTVYGESNNKHEHAIPFELDYMFPAPSTQLTVGEFTLKNMSNLAQINKRKFNVKRSDSINTSQVNSFLSLAIEGFKRQAAIINNREARTQFFELLSTTLKRNETISAIPLHNQLIINYPNDISGTLSMEDEALHPDISTYNIALKNVSNNDLVEIVKLIASKKITQTNQHNKDI